MPHNALRCVPVLKLVVVAAIKSETNATLSVDLVVKAAQIVVFVEALSKAKPRHAWTAMPASRVTDELEQLF